MKFIETTALKKILSLKKRLKIIQGGTGASKTISTLLILIDRAQSEKNKLISVVSETLPHLRRGAMRDFLSIMESHHYYQDNRWNKTDSVYEFESGSKIEFFGADHADKVRGPRRDILFINEANNVSEETYTQLAIRTNEDIYLDFNPVSSFFALESLVHRDDAEYLILTYRDNEGLPAEIVKEIESRKDSKNFWTVYGLGQLGEMDTKIFTGWQFIDEIPHEARLWRRGLDFGYTNDPSALVDLYQYNGGFIVDELLFQKGMSNKQIADVMLNQPEKVLCIADSSEPKSIDEISSYGIPIIGCEKGPGSVMQQIQHVQDQRISVTKRSVNVIKEYRNYLWKTDKNGKSLNEPEHEFSHSLDAIRYGFNGSSQQFKERKPAGPAPRPYFRRNFQTTH